MSSRSNASGTSVKASGEVVALRSPLGAKGAIDACEKLARSGKLPGFERDAETACRARVFGQPFDRDLFIDAAESAGSGCIVRLRTQLRRRVPVIFVLVGVLTVWPGVWLTDSLIQTYFSAAQGWAIKTWMWYLPITILPLPFAAKSMWRKSQVQAAEHFAELQERIAQAVGASKDASSSVSSKPETLSASA
ncbi:MAG: hypothetical protein KF684_12320 [Phycisphaeraceae bacterium]|nr:hypothetical protein [Phycisphaeraceae bacterium]